MTLEELHFLTTAEGRRLLDRAAEIDGEDAESVARLRRSWEPRYCSAALTLVRLRRRARRKFARAEEMVFGAEGLEQASSERVAEHRAARFRGMGRVADLCCGIGADTIALTGAGTVFPVDIDPIRIRMARHNVGVYAPSAQAWFLCGDVTNGLLPEVEGIFIDPSRRREGRRVVRSEEYAPPLSFLYELQRITPNLAAKVSPAIDEAEIPPGCEVEFVSEYGECKEAVLWFGDFATATRRATLLPGGYTLTSMEVPSVPCGPPKPFLYEPDRAVVRAHLVEQLAHRLDATRLDERIAYLTADHFRTTPFARAFEITDLLPFHLKRLRKLLRTRGIGVLEIKKRRFPIEPDAMRGLLDLEGENAATLILTRISGVPVALLCRDAGTDVSG